MNEVVLRPISMCPDQDKLAVRDVRNQDSVRMKLFTEQKVSLETHLEWLERLKEDKSQVSLAVYLNQLVVGLVSLTAIDLLHRKCEWGIFLDESARGGLGAAIEFELLNYVFFNLNFEKLNCEVIKTNNSVLRLHDKFGFHIEGIRRENIIKGDQRIDVVLLGITRVEWLNGRSAFEAQYRKLIKYFNIIFDWDDRELLV